MNSWQTETQIIKDYENKKLSWSSAIERLMKEEGHSRVDAEKLLRGGKILTK